MRKRVRVSDLVVSAQPSKCFQTETSASDRRLLAHAFSIPIPLTVRRERIDNQIVPCCEAPSNATTEARRSTSASDAPISAYERVCTRLAGAPLSLPASASEVEEVSRKSGVAPKRLHLDDLLLGRAAVHGSSAAQAMIVEQVERPVLKHARRAGVAREDAAEEWQSIVLRLVDSSASNLPQGYAGRASLVLYLRTVHLRASFLRRSTTGP